MAGNVRFVAAPRKVVEQSVGEGELWRHLGQRWLEQAIATCPVGEEGDGWVGPHLRDTLELRVVTGADPRLMVGSRTRGEVLGYVVQGTEPHSIDPVKASVLRFQTGGTVVFAAHVDHHGTAANPFVLDAVRKVIGAG